MHFDPYWNQKNRKSSTRWRVLNYIDAKPSTFTEILNGVGLSRPVLTQHLDELLQNGSIRRRAEGKRDVYELTKEGKGFQRLLREGLSESFSLLIKLAQNPDAVKTLNEMARFGKESPEFLPFLQAWMQWYTNYVTAMLSDEGIKWFNRHGKASSSIMMTELSKELGPLLEAKRKSGGPTSPQEFLPFLDQALVASLRVIHRKGEAQ